MVKVRLTLYNNMKKVGNFKVDYLSESIHKYVEYSIAYAKEQNDLQFNMIQVDGGRMVIVPISEKMLFATSFAYQIDNNVLEDMNILVIDDKVINIEDEKDKFIKYFRDC